VASSFVNCLIIAPQGAPLAGTLITLTALGFIALALGQAIASWTADLVEGRRRLRAFIVVAAAIDGAVHAGLQLFTASPDPTPVVSAANAILIAAIVAIVAWSLARMGAEDLFPRATSAPLPTEAPARDADPAARKLVDRLTALMAVERLYRQEGLTIGTLASRLGIPEYRLRRLINQRLGYRNFNAFLNSYRIGEAKAALADPGQAEVPITTIALDAGFQSLGPFNRAFKTDTGLTPSEYRRASAAAG
jgi:AraC-like DNA-binding protein